MISPGEALRTGQIWLRPFGTFAPCEQAYMGFPSDTIRDNFLDAIDDGALAVIWIRQKDGDREWKGRFCGILRLERRAALALDLSSRAGETQRRANDSQYAYAVPVVQAWEADPARVVMMKGVIPSLWPDFTRIIGRESLKMPAAEIPNILSRCIREVSVYGRPPVTPGTFQTVRSLFQ